MTILRLTRRFIAVSAVTLWVGGFTFYTAFVIPIGHRQLSAGKFGFVTGEVTSLLNVLAGIALPVLLVNLLSDWSGSSRLWRWGTLGSWTLALAATLGLYLLHARLDGLLDYPHRDISQPDRFQSLHERYELVATLQWTAGVVHLWCMLAGWRNTDESKGGRRASQRTDQAVS